MTSGTLASWISKSFNVLMLLSLLLSSTGVNPVRAQDGTVQEPVAPTPLPELTGLGGEAVNGLDLTAAGTGSVYRAVVALNQPKDLSRLMDWGVTVLESYVDSAIVQVTPLQLNKLARLGFEPTQVDSVDYMLTAHALMTGDLLSQSDVTASAAEMLALASVDTDADGLTDTEESWWCTDPNDENSDSPQPSSQTNPNDGTEVNNILRGIIAYGPPFALWPQFTPHNPNGNCPDGDYDGAPDYAEEFMIGTSNLRESSDKDKFDDGQELFGVTYCPAASGPCGYGILPRAEDAAFVSANLPAWVKAPGNSPFVAAFPEPEVEVIPSSLNLTQVTVITNTKGTVIGTEKTYGTSSTKGASTSLANTVTWNEWDSVSETTMNSLSDNIGRQRARFGISLVTGIGGCILGVAGAISSPFTFGTSLALSAAGGAVCGASLVAAKVEYDQLKADIKDTKKDNVENTTNPNKKDGAIQIGVAPKVSTNNNATQNQKSSEGGTEFSVNQNSILTSQAFYPVSYPISGTTTNAHGVEHGGAQTSTTTQYEEQTISESSTNQYSDTWSTATAVDSAHAADLRFTYNIVNTGTEYAREVTSLTFNIYIGANPNPAYTYVAVGATGQIAKVENLFPGDTLTYTSNPIALTLDEMRAIDEGAPVRVVMEDISFGQDQVFYLDALSGSVTVAMEDGFDDNDEVVDTYVVPVWDPSDSLQDVIKRYFPVTEDASGNLLSVYTPESATAVPARCEQNLQLAPASYTTVFCKHSLTGTSWWNIYLSDGLTYNGVFGETLAQPNTTVLVRVVSDRDLDGYNDRNEIRLGTDPDDPASHPAPNLIAGYTTSCTANDCTVRMVFQNLGNYDAYGVESVMYSPDGLSTITNNTIGGSGGVPAGARIVVGPSDTFQYTKTAGAVEPVIAVSYNDPQGNHRFVLPSGNYPAGAQIATLDDVITALSGKMLLDPGVDISSTSSNQAGFVINSPHPSSITNGKLFVEYIDGNGTVLHEDVFTQNFDSGPTVVQQTIDTVTYPPTTTILLAFFTDSAGNIIDSSARPLASFGADPAPEANITVDNWEIGAQSLVSIPNPWNLGTFEPGTTLHARLYLTNTGLGDLRYSLSGLGGGWSIAGNPAGMLGPTQQNVFELTFDSAGMTPQTINKTLYLRTNDPANGTVTINLNATLGTPAGGASAYQVSPYEPWNQMVYVPGPRVQNDTVTFTHTLADDPSRMFPLYMYNEAGTTLKGVGEYGVDFSGQTAPFGVFGTGADGDLTVTTGQTVYTDNTRSALAVTANGGQPNIILASATGFAAGQEVLVIQIQGPGAGLYEFSNIANVSGNTLTLTNNLKNAYTVGGNSKAQVIRVMQYQNVTVQSGGILTAHAWDGSTGGIVALKVSNALLVQTEGTITMSGKGFRGGATGNVLAYQGEGTGGNGINSANANGNGGGGGRNNSTNIGTYPYQTGSGGGGGGNGGTGSDGIKHGGLDSGAIAGFGGSSSGSSDLLSMTFGGGGGAGAGDQGGGSLGNGGTGGGIITLHARMLTNSGTIVSSGTNGGNVNSDHDAGGGGGAGGSILIKARDAASGDNLISALGGIGGNGCHGSNGGTGSSGRIRVEYGTLSGITNPPASTQQVNYYSITGQGAPFGVFGNGSDGNLTVAAGQTVYTDNVRSALASTASAGQNTITLSNTAGFAVGKEVMIIQIQGTGAGAYEFAAVNNVSGNVLTLSKSLGNTFIVNGNSKAQVLLIPQYQNVTIQSSGILTAHAWDGNSGGIVAFRTNGTATVSGLISVTGKGFRGGAGGINVSAGYQGEGTGGASSISINSNGNGGGGGGLQTSGGTFEGPGGGGGGNGTEGANGVNVGSTGIGGTRGSITSDNELTILTLGGAGGGGSGISQYSFNRGYYSTGGLGGNGGGIIFVNTQNLVITGSIVASGTNGSGATGPSTFAGAGGGGSGGSVLIKAYSATLGSNLINFTNGIGALAVQNPQGNGGNGGAGRVRIEYATMTGTTNPSASTQQVNYYNLTGSSSNTLYIPEEIGAGSYLRYKLLYGQRSVNTTGGNQLFTVHVANRQYASVTLSSLIEQVVGSGSTFNFCLDFGNDVTCDYTANSQAFTGPVRLDSTNLANALNAYITAQASAAPVITIPIRVNISTPADIFTFNLSATPLSGVDLSPSVVTITPPNSNPASNIPEGTMVDLNATVTNSGITSASNFTVGFYNGDPANGGTLIGSTFIQSLAAGATSPAQTVIWNTSGLLGAKTIYVKADASNVINETNEANNASSSAAVVKKKPDLTVVSLQVPNVRAGETGSASVVVRNNGEADVSGAVVRLYEGTSTAGTVLNSVTANVPQGQSVSVAVSFSLAIAGSKYLFVMVDPLNAIVEAEEGNNTAAGSTKAGWNLLTIDAGGAGDTAYSAGNGYGWLTSGSAAVTTCGNQIQQSHRQAGSAESLQYRFDNLLPGRSYHLDLTFATCSGDRWLDVYVDGNQVTDLAAGDVTLAGISPYQVTTTPRTASLLLDPAAYATDGSVELSINRNTGFGGPIVNIIDLQEVKHCYQDSGPGETPWSAENQCGYDSIWTSDGFNGWGTQPAETVRYGAGSVKYKYSGLVPAKKYNLRMTYYEGDNALRSQRVTFDGVNPSTNFTLSSTAITRIIALPSASYADGLVVVAMERPLGGEAVVSEVTLEEDTRTENSRYAVPSGGTITPPTPPVTTPPQVTISSFAAAWVGSQVKVDWGASTEINNDQFDLYRATSTSGPWVLAGQVVSKHACGTYTSTTPEAYTYTDAVVSAGTTYYYKLNYSGAGCGVGAQAYAMTARAEFDSAPFVLSITRASANPTVATTVNFTVLFSESVTGVDSADFKLTLSGVTGALITSISPASGSSRTVVVNRGTGNGTIRLDVIDNNSIIDATSKPLGGGALGDGDYIGGEFYTIGQPTQGVITDTWAIKISPFANVSQLAAQLGAQNLGQIGSLTGHYLFRITGSNTQSENIASLISANPQVLWFEQQVARQQSKRGYSEIYPPIEILAPTDIVAFEEDKDSTAEKVSYTIYNESETVETSSWINNSISIITYPLTLPMDSIAPTQTLVITRLSPFIPTAQAQHTKLSARAIEPSPTPPIFIHPSSLPRKSTNPINNGATVTAIPIAFCLIASGITISLRRKKQSVNHMAK